MIRIMQRAVPFFSNTPDNTHCFQATIRSVLAYYMPERTFTFEQLDALSAKKEGLATWPQAMLLQLSKMGFDVIIIENFDAQRFIDEGEQYLEDAYGKEAAAWQIANSDIPQERNIYKDIIKTKNITIIQRPASLNDVKQFIDQGYLVQAMVNARVLANKKGYVGHSVLIYDYTIKGLRMHNPGLPAHESQHISYDDFSTSWESPNKRATNCIAIRLNEGET